MQRESYFMEVKSPPPSLYAHAHTPSKIPTQTSASTLMEFGDC